VRACTLSVEPRTAGPQGTIADALDLAASSDRGVAFYSTRGIRERALSYKELHARAVTIARQLRAAGFERGQRLGLVAETGAPFLIVFYACQYAGLIPCPLPFTNYLGGKDAYIRRLATLTRAARLTAVVAPVSLQSCLAGVGKAAGLRTLTYDDLLLAELGDKGGRELSPLGADDPAYIQYSSGSTADPKGILISQRALCANVESILVHGLRLSATDRAFSWLPFYHDMGLVGFSIAPVFGLCNVDYISPSTFARRPRLWLELMSDNRSTITYSPTFGYRLAAQRYGSGEKPVNLSALRVAGVGGDMVRADVLHDFAEVTAETGFRREAFLPCYGMAEAALAVTFSDLETPPLIDCPLGMSNKYVGCGKPLPEIDLRIVDENGHPVPEGVIGTIWLRGPNVSGAYIDNPEATRSIQRSDGFIDSGDLGYLIKGQLVVTGRSKDLILHNGRNIWPQDVEWVAERVAPLKPGDVAAIGLVGDAEDQLVVLVQCGLTEEEARAALRWRVISAVSEAVGVSAKVVLVGPHDLPLTSSGKLSRSRAKTLLPQNGTIGVESATERVSANQSMGQ
jgi:fatty-acyl-CoA synthase